MQHTPRYDRAIREIDEVENQYATKSADYAYRVRKVCHAARSAIEEIERELEASDAVRQRDVAALHERIAQLQAGTQLDQRIAILEDDEYQVRAEFDGPKRGWELQHLEDLAMRLRAAGAEDRTKLTGLAAKVSANVPNTGIIRLDIDSDRRDRDWAAAKPPAMPPGDDPRAGHPMRSVLVGGTRPAWMDSSTRRTAVAVAAVLFLVASMLLAKAFG